MKKFILKMNYLYDQDLAALDIPSIKFFCITSKL